jgi:hypothetical protein
MAEDRELNKMEEEIAKMTALVPDSDRANVTAKAMYDVSRGVPIDIAVKEALEYYDASGLTTTGAAVSAEVEK